MDGSQEHAERNYSGFLLRPLLGRALSSPREALRGRSSPWSLGRRHDGRAGVNPGHVCLYGELTAVV